MSAAKARQQEYSESTREALMDAAAALFVERGYSNTALQDVAEMARVSKGAVYHHFSGKQALFEAVFDRVSEALVEQVVSEALRHRDPWLQASAVLRTFLSGCTEPRYRKLALEEGPVALGWSSWRDRDGTHTDRVLGACLSALEETGGMRPVPVELVTALFVGAVHEAAFSVVNSDDPATTEREAASLLRELLTALRVKTPARVPPRARLRTRPARS